MNFNIPLYTYCWQLFCLQKTRSDGRKRLIHSQDFSAMKEVFLHYVWQYKLFCPTHLRTTDGTPIEIIDHGKKNTNAGPDFFNAKVKIGETLWVGNIEIHLLSSDWMRHRHDQDRRYDNVILHVVKEHDKEIFRPNGDPIPTLILQPYPGLQERYEAMSMGATFIHCANYWEKLPDGFMRIYLNQLLTERLCRKAASIIEKVEQTKGDWEEAFYQTLATAFGQSTNALPFEKLSQSLPIKLISKQHDNLVQIEALLFGQAGLLNDYSTDSYEKRLKQEYDFLQNKFGLKSIDKNLWVFAKMRPSNFPHIKIAQLSQILFKYQNLFSSILAAKGTSELRSLFEVDTSPYWENHYSFGDQSIHRTKKMGETSIDLLLINVVVPILFAYAQKRENPDLAERAIDLLTELPAEKNSIISQWRSLNVECRNAYDSQALLELKKRYCNEKNCLRCAIAHQVLKN